MVLGLLFAINKVFGVEYYSQRMRIQRREEKKQNPDNKPLHHPTQPIIVLFTEKLKICDRQLKWKNESKNRYVDDHKDGWT